MNDPATSSIREINIRIVRRMRQGISPAGSLLTLLLGEVLCFHVLEPISFCSSRPLLDRQPAIKDAVTNSGSGSAV